MSSYPIKPMSFRVVKRLVINDFKKTADKFSDFVKKCYLNDLEKATTVHGLLSVMAGINSGRTLGAMELLLDLIIVDNISKSKPQSIWRHLNKVT
jgi:hypothetical protein